MREIGHGTSRDAGRMDEFIKRRVALARGTDSIRNEREMMRAVLSWRRGAYRPGTHIEGLGTGGDPAASGLYHLPRATFAR